MLYMFHDIDSDVEPILLSIIKHHNRERKPKLKAYLILSQLEIIEFYAESGISTFYPSPTVSTQHCE